MNPGKYNIKIQQGADFDLRIKWSTRDNLGTVTTVDISGYTAQLQIKPEEGLAVQWNSEGDDPVITIDETTNEFVIAVPYTQTKNYAFTKGEYEFEVISPSPDVKKHRILKGKVSVEQELVS